MSGESLNDLLSKSSDVEGSLNDKMYARALGGSTSGGGSAPGGGVAIGDKTPATLTGAPTLGGWWRPEGLLVADNVGIDSWRDDSGNNRHALQATGAKQPVATAANLLPLNGLRAAKFDGVGTEIAALTNGMADTSIFSLCQVVILRAVGNQSTYFSSNAGFQQLNGGWKWSAGGAGIGNSGGAQAGLYVITFTTNATASFIWLNGMPYHFAGSAGAVGPKTSVIGSSNGGGYLNGFVAETCVYPLHALNTQQVTEFHRYVANKFALPIAIPTAA